MTEYTRENMPHDLKRLAEVVSVWPKDALYAAWSDLASSAHFYYELPKEFEWEYEEHQWKAARQALGLDSPEYVWDDNALPTEEEEEEWQRKESEQADMVNKPPHYQSDNGIECIDAIRAQMSSDQFAAYCQGNIAKYIWRWRAKSGIESLKKAQWYLAKMIDEVSNG